MKEILAKLKKIPSWIIMLLIFGILYFTGLHKDAAALIQRGFLSIGFMAADVPTIDAEVLDKNIEGEKVDERMLNLNLRMKKISGEKGDLSDFKDKVIFLNLWATWCPPCRAEMPNIHSLYKDVASDDIVFVMLSLDNDEAKVKEFMDKHKFTFPVYKPLSNIPEAFQTKSIPSTFIISPQAEIVFQHEGMADYDTDKVKNFLRKMVN